MQGPRRLLPSARLAALAIAAASLAACASGTSHHPAGAGSGSDFGVVVGTSTWIHAPTESWVADTLKPACRTPACAALEPNDPWLGTIGVRRLIPGACELGFGVTVPKSFAPAGASAPV